MRARAGQSQCWYAVDNIAGLEKDSRMFQEGLQAEDAPGCVLRLDRMPLQPSGYEPQGHLQACP